MMLTGLDLIRKALARRPAELEQARNAGQKIVGWIGYNVPEELITACGMIPVRIGWGGDNRLAENGTNYLSTLNCSFLRHCVGLFAERKDPYIQMLDLVITDTTCTQLHRMTAILEHYFSAQVIRIGYPKDPTREESRIYFAHEMQHLQARLAELSGTAYDSQALARSVQLYLEIRKAQSELYELAARPNSMLHWREVHEVVQAGYCLDREQYRGLLHELLNEARLLEAESPQLVQSARVLITGSTMVTGDTKVVGILESLGATIVGDLMWTGFADIADFECAQPSLEGLTDAYLNRFRHAALPYIEIDHDRKLTQLLELAQRWKAQGVVYISLRYCDPFSFKAQATKEFLKLAGIPMLEIQTDYSTMDGENLRTRAEAFLEMLTI